MQLPVPGVTRWLSLLSMSLVLVAGCRPSGERADGGARRESAEIRSPTDAATCPTCEIEIRWIGSIGDESDSIFPTVSAKLRSLAAGQYVVCPVSERRRLAIFDSAGVLARLAAKGGEGPGELTGCSDVTFGPDSLAMVQHGNRLVWFSAEQWTPVDTRVLARRIPGGNLLALDNRRFVSTQSMRRTPRFLTNLGSDSVRGFGISNVDSTMPDLEGYPTAVLVPLEGTRFLALDSYFRPSMEEWDAATGEQLRRYLLPAPWFREYDYALYQQWLVGGPSEVAMPITYGAWRDSLGRLWTVTQVTDADWKLREDVRAIEGEGVRRVPYWGGDDRAMLDAIVAVYELTDSTVSLLTWKRFDEPLNGILQSGVLYARSWPDRDRVSFALYRARLTAATTALPGDPPRP